MRLRLLLAAAFVLAFAAAIPSSSSAATSKKHRCTAKGAETVKKNRYGRVFTTPGRDGEIVARLWGCLYKAGRRVPLDTALDDDYVTQESFNAVKLNRNRVAWQHTRVDISCKADCPPGYDPDSAELRVANLRTRRIRTVPGELGEGTALVVTRTGAIAWIQPGTPVSVRASDADGTRVLYAGDDIDGGSLSLSGNTVAWVAGGQTKSAPLR
jgi:hypothetical protein